MKKIETTISAPRLATLRAQAVKLRDCARRARVSGCALLTLKEEAASEAWQDYASARNLPESTGRKATRTEYRKRQALPMTREEAFPLLFARVAQDVLAEEGYKPEAPKPEAPKPMTLGALHAAVDAAWKASGATKQDLASATDAVWSALLSGEEAPEEAPEASSMIPEVDLTRCACARLAKYGRTCREHARAQA